MAGQQRDEGGGWSGGGAWMVEGVWTVVLGLMRGRGSRVGWRRRLLREMRASHAVASSGAAVAAAGPVGVAEEV